MQGSGIAQDTAPHGLAGHASWTVWGLEATVAVTDAGLLAAATDTVREVVAAVDEACSRFRPDSELMRLQPRMAGGVRISPTLRHLLERALDAARMTDGDVDPTLGADLAALGHGPGAPAEPRLPEDQFGPQHPGIRSVPVGPLAALPGAPAPRMPGWSRLRLVVLPADSMPAGMPAGPQRPAFTASAPAMLTVPSGLSLDLGASAKAVAADLAAAEVHRKLGCGVLVGLGGDLASAGPGPGTEGTAGPWQILVQDLPADPAQQISLAAGFSLATSSTQKRRWKHQGSQVHHILDPRFGLPAEAVWHSVTVAAPTCLEANAFSTAAIVRGFAAIEWFRREGVPARLVDSRGRVTITGGWPGEDRRPAGQQGADRSGTGGSARRG